MTRMSKEERDYIGMFAAMIPGEEIPVKEFCQKIAQDAEKLLDDLDAADAEIASLRAKLERLVSAIKAHRETCWAEGDDPTVWHEPDEVLYAVMEEVEHGG